LVAHWLAKRLLHLAAHAGALHFASNTFWKLAQEAAGIAAASLADPNFAQWCVAQVVVELLNGDCGTTCWLCQVLHFFEASKLGEYGTARKACADHWHVWSGRHSSTHIQAATLLLVLDAGCWLHAIVATLRAEHHPPFFVLFGVQTFAASHVSFDAHAHSTHGNTEAVRRLAAAGLQATAASLANRQLTDIHKIALCRHGCDKMF